MSTFVIVLGVIQLAVALSSLASRPPSRRNPTQARDAPVRSVTLFVPCCGAEEGLEANLQALLSQQCPDSRICFVVEDGDDEAVPVIESLGGEIVIAGTAVSRGQKVHNLLAAIDSVPPTEIWAFADSDGRPDPDWLGRLVAALEEPAVGVASTYRFYVPEPTNFTTLLRSVWNASVLALLGDHDRNFAWGGGMAIRRDVFEKARVREAWAGALSDDYALTHAVRRAGLRVAFVPENLVPSYGSTDLSELLSWVARQVKITRVYWPRLFRMAAVHHVLYSTFLLLGAWAGGPAGRGLWIGVLVLGGWTGFTRARSNPWAKRYAWAYATLFPFASVLTVQAVVRSLLSRRIEWRGKVYEMRSPSETVVIR